MATSISGQIPSDFFARTNWNLVRRAAGKGTDPDPIGALNELFQCYRYPLYSYVRHRGHSPEDADDIIQGFLLDFHNREAITRVAPEKGRFRAFLLASLKNYLANDWDRRRAIKRGGAAVFVALDEVSPEALYRQMSVDASADPDRIFDRSWAQQVFRNAYLKLKAEYEEELRTDVFSALECVLTLDGRDIPYDELARRLSKTVSAVRMASQRLRRRYSTLVKREIRVDMGNPDQLDDELRYLAGCL